MRSTFIFFTSFCFVGKKLQYPTWCWCGPNKQMQVVGPVRAQHIFLTTDAFVMFVHYPHCYVAFLCNISMDAVDILFLSCFLKSIFNFFFYYKPTMLYSFLFLFYFLSYSISFSFSFLIYYIRVFWRYY